MKLLLNYSNLCDYDTWTSQTERRTDRQTDGRFAVTIPRSAYSIAVLKTQQPCVKGLRIQSPTDGSLIAWRDVVINWPSDWQASTWHMWRHSTTDHRRPHVWLHQYSLRSMRAIFVKYRQLSLPPRYVVNVTVISWNKALHESICRNSRQTRRQSKQQQLTFSLLRQYRYVD